MYRLTALRSYLLLTFILSLFVNSFVVAAQQPFVAIKAPDIGDGVKSSAKRHLNTQTMLAEMERAIAETRKFQLVSRTTSKLKAIRDEQKLAKSTLARGNAAQEGNLSNANYLILPTVQDFKFYRVSKSVPNIDDKYTRQDFGLLDVSVQLIDTTTGAINATFSMKSKFSTSKSVVNKKGGSPSTVHFAKMAKKVATKMADQLIDTLYPMKVMARKKKQVYINRGQDGGLKVGTILEVYEPGELIIDEATNTVLGSTEELIGKIKIIRVNPKLTIANIKSESAPISKGAIIRRPQ